MVTKRWLEQIVKCLDALGVGDDATCIMLAVFQLRYTLETWWKRLKGCYREELGAVQTDLSG